MKNNIDTVYKTRCESRFQGILDIRKSGYYYIPEFYLSQQPYRVPNLRDRFNEYLNNKMDKLILNNIRIAHNISNLQNKFIEYLIDKTVKLTSDLLQKSEPAIVR